jgi:hypothetical protein
MARPLLTRTILSSRTGAKRVPYSRQTAERTLKRMVTMTYVARRIHYLASRVQQTVPEFQRDCGEMQTSIGRVAPPSRQGGRVAKRQDAAPCGYELQINIALLGKSCAPTRFTSGTRMAQLLVASRPGRTTALRGGARARGRATP